MKLSCFNCRRGLAFPSAAATKHHHPFLKDSATKRRRLIAGSPAENGHSRGGYSQPVALLRAVLLM